MFLLRTSSASFVCLFFLSFVGSLVLYSRIAMESRLSGEEILRVATRNRVSLPLFLHSFAKNFYFLNKLKLLNYKLPPC